MSLVLVTRTCFMCRNRFFGIISLYIYRWRIGPCNWCGSFPRVFRAAVYTNFHLDWERRLLELSIQFFGRKCRQKMVILSFFGYLAEIESDSQTVWTYLHMHHYCTTVSDSSFQVLICSSWRYSTSRTFVRFLAGPALGYQVHTRYIWICTGNTR